MRRLSVRVVAPLESAPSPGELIFAPRCVNSQFRGDRLFIGIDGGELADRRERTRYRFITLAGPAPRQAPSGLPPSAARGPDVERERLRRVDGAARALVVGAVAAAIRLLERVLEIVVGAVECHHAHPLARRSIAAPTHPNVQNLV